MPECMWNVLECMVELWHSSYFLVGLMFADEKVNVVECYRMLLMFRLLWIVIFLFLLQYKNGLAAIKA